MSAFDIHAYSNTLALNPMTLTVGASYLSPPNNPPPSTVKCVVKQPFSANDLNFEIQDPTQLYTIRDSCYIFIP